MTDIYYYSAPWCGPCKQFAPLFDRVSQDFNINVRKINVDTVGDDSHALKTAIQHEVMSVPMLVKVQNGTVLDRHIGTMDEQQLREFLTV